MESKCKNSNAADKRAAYPDSLKAYTGEILLVAVNYDKKTKGHQCLIEKYEKEG